MDHVILPKSDSKAMVSSLHILALSNEKAVNLWFSLDSSVALLSL